MKTRLIVLCLMFLAASAFIARASRPEIVSIREPLYGIPMQIGRWEGRQAPDLDSSTLAILGVDDYVNRIYHSPEFFPGKLVYWILSEPTRRGYDPFAAELPAGGRVESGQERPHIHSCGRQPDNRN